MGLDEAVKKKLPALFLLSFSTFVVCVPAAMTQIISFDLMFDLDSFPSKGYAWTFPLFVAGECASMALAACIIDRYGRRIPYAFGAVLFIVATCFCAMCRDMDLFLIGRIVEGFGAGLVIVTCIAQIYFDVPDKQSRYIANGIMSLGFGAGMLFGLFAGKAFVETIGWPTAFWILAVAQAVLTYPALQILKNGETSEMKADIPGAIIATVWAGVLVYLLQKLYLEWDVESPVALEWVAFLILMTVLFVFVEIVNPHSVFHRKIDGGRLTVACMVFIILLGLIDMATVGYMVKIAFFTYGMSVGEAAPFFIILVCGAAITAITISKVIHKTGHLPWFLLSTILSPVALISMVMVKEDDPSIFFALHLFVLGLAIGCLVSMLNATIQNRTTKDNNGAIMSFAIMIRTVGLWMGYNCYQAFSDYYMREAMADTMAHWNEILHLDLPADSALASLLLTPLGDFVRLVPGLSEKIASAFAEGVGLSLTGGAIVFVVVAIPMMILAGRRKMI